MSKSDHQKVAALRTVRILQQNGYTALFAGGCVRDELIGRQPKDYDVATDARPDVVEALFPRTIAIGKAFGVIAVVHGKETIEVATFRKESGTADGRHPETVHFCAAREDALRRDFTINGMFLDPVNGELLDYVGGEKDLKARRIAAIGDPFERFQEDHLRMLRAVRFAHTLGFSMDPATEVAVRQKASCIARISAERIEMELTRILTESLKPGDALLHLQKTGLLEQILPEAIPMIGQKQPPQFHPEGDVFEHTVLMLNLMKDHPSSEPTYTPRELAYTVLLHDIGKPSTARIGKGTDGDPRIRFDGHAVVSAEMSDLILTRLRFPNREKKNIIEAIRGHMRFMDVQNMRQAKLRRMIGSGIYDLEMELHRLDCLGSHRMMDNYDFMRGVEQQIEDEPVLPDPWIRGHDLLDIGIAPGRMIGIILKEAYDAQIEQQFSDRKDLLNWIREKYVKP